VDATRRFVVRSTLSRLLQTSKVSFGSINSAKGFGLPQAESSHKEVTPRGLHLVQNLVERLRNIILFSWFWMDSAHGAGAYD
jgi:hypothetical protein